MPDFVTIALSTWCTLTSSYGELIHSALGIGGVVYISRTIVVGLPASTIDAVVKRNRINGIRRRTILLGALTAFILLFAIGFYFYCADLLRPLGPTCDISNAPANGAGAVGVLYSLYAIAAALAGWFFVRVNKHPK